MFLSKLYSPAFVAVLTTLVASGWAQEPPCDASTQACLNVMQANTCFAAYIRGNNVTEMLRCVNVDDQTLAREEVSTRLAPLADISLTNPSCVLAMDALRRAFSDSSPLATYASKFPAVLKTWRRAIHHEPRGGLESQLWEDEAIVRVMRPSEWSAVQVLSELVGNLEPFSTEAVYSQLIHQSTQRHASSVVKYAPFTYQAC